MTTLTNENLGALYTSSICGTTQALTEWIDDISDDELENSSFATKKELANSYINVYLFKVDAQ